MVTTNKDIARPESAVSDSSRRDGEDLQNDLIPTVFLVDDDAKVRQTLEALINSLGFCVSGFASGQMFLDHYRVEQPGCVLLDICMPHFNGLQVQARLRRLPYMPPVVMISGVAEIQLAVEAMKLGAIDFLKKPITRSQVQQVVATALNLDQRLRYQWQQQKDVQFKMNQLSEKEQLVLELVVKGLLNKQIASRLEVTTRTIELRRASILRKLDVRNVGELMRFIYIASQLHANNASGSPFERHRPDGVAWNAEHLMAIDSVYLAAG